MLNCLSDVLVPFEKSPIFGFTTFVIYPEFDTKYLTQSETQQ